MGLKSRGSVVFLPDEANPSECGEGQHYIGALQNVQTDESGYAHFSFPLPPNLGQSPILTATVTCLLHDWITSEFTPVFQPREFGPKLPDPKEPLWRRFTRGDDDLSMNQSISDMGAPGLTCSLRLYDIRLVDHRTLEFWLQEITGKPHVIEASHDLIKWWELLLTNAPSEPFRIQDPAVEIQSRRFYRVLVAPDPR
ncbi:MAG TPA: hypothetical protein P5186_13875 [Candidatus Paceibacterota bacterium]|nr:hypothetical protein [Verrucomicrobiota bacterium]HRY49132.1 hypothetical protein [Candidatus Paceibacterota bacterium]HRZ99840.1 hypothetical protein [Candidatus Paceibacterota bacterium]